MTTDHEKTEREPTDPDLAEKGGHRNILLSPDPSCPNPHFVMKPLREIA